MKWWRNLSNLGIETDTDRGLRRRAQMTNRMIFIAICVGFSYVPMYLSIQLYEPLVQNLVLTILTSLLFILAIKGKHETAAILLCFLLLLHIVSVSIAIQGGTARFFLIAISVLGFTMIRDIRISVLIFLISLGAFFFSEYAYHFFKPFLIRSASDNVVVYSFNITLIFLGLFYLIFHLKRTNDYFECDVLDQKQKIELQHKLLDQSHTEMKESIRYARRIQSAILPSNQKIDELLKDNFVIYLPKDVVAGDFYWIEQKKDFVIMAVADCTGHGVPGAMISVICHNALNRAVRDYELIIPGEILNKAREILISELKDSEESIRDGMDVALITIQYNQQGEIKQLQFAGANNPLWLFSDGTLTEFGGDKQPVGIYENAFDYTTHNIPVKKGDTIYVFSDGYVDQFGGNENLSKNGGKKYTVKRFRNLIAEIDSLTLTDQKNAILNSFETWKGDLEQIDDICIIGFKV